MKEEASFGRKKNLRLYIGSIYLEVDSGRKKEKMVGCTLIYCLFFVVVVLGPFGVMVAGNTVYMYRAYEQTNLCGLWPKAGLKASYLRCWTGLHPLAFSYTWNVLLENSSPLAWQAGSQLWSMHRVHSILFYSLFSFSILSFSFFFFRFSFFVFLLFSVSFSSIFFLVFSFLFPFGSVVTPVYPV